MEHVLPCLIVVRRRLCLMPVGVVSAVVVRLSTESRSVTRITLLSIVMLLPWIGLGADEEIIEIVAIVQEDWYKKVGFDKARACLDERT